MCSCCTEQVSPGVADPVLGVSSKHWLRHKRQREWMRVAGTDSKIKGVTGKPETVPYHKALTAFIFELGWLSP